MADIYPTSVSAYIASHKYPAKDHARAVAKYLSLESGTIYVESQKARMHEDCDQEEPFRQRRYFFYLSGCDLPESYLTYNIADDKLTLYIPPINPEEVMWSGLPLTAEQGMEKFDVDAVKYSDELEKDVQSLGGDVLGIPLQISEKAFSSTIKAESKLKDAIDECRAFKDDYEVALIRHANEISTLAHQALMKAINASSQETELEAIFLENCVSRGAKNQAYGSIVASGRNAATLHYVRNNESYKGRLNILVDAGCEYDTYASDITRVSPIGGTFTEKSKAIYNLVLQMQTESLAMCQPGVLWDKIHLNAHMVLINGLLELGILHNGTAQEILDNRTSVAFFPHGLGHMMGMNTHDTGGHPNYSDEDKMFKYLRVRIPLKERHVITVEPGCYFCEFIIKPYLEDPKHFKYINKEVLDEYWDVGGVRIEDNILVTKDGYENLTNTVKQVEDVERMVGHKFE